MITYGTLTQHRVNKATPTCTSKQQEDDVFMNLDYEGGVKGGEGAVLLVGGGNVSIKVCCWVPIWNVGGLPQQHRTEELKENVSVSGCCCVLPWGWRGRRFSSTREGGGGGGRNVSVSGWSCVLSWGWRRGTGVLPFLALGGTRGRNTSTHE